MHKLLDFRLNQRADDIIDFLKVVFPEIKFSSDFEDGRNCIYTEVELSDEQAKEVYQKLKNTQLHFVDRNNSVYN